MENSKACVYFFKQMNVSGSEKVMVMIRKAWMKFMIGRGRRSRK